MRAPIAEGSGFAWFANRAIGRPLPEFLAETMAWFRVWLDEVALRQERRIPMSSEIDGYGKRDDQSDIDRLLEDCRTLAPSGIERIAQGRMTLVGTGLAENVSDHKGASSVDHDAWHEAERVALHVLETTNRVPLGTPLQSILELNERHDAMVAWREEHGEAGHRAEDAVLGAALALSARPGLDVAHEATCSRR